MNIIKEVRKHFNLTQAEFASKMKLSQSLVSSLELGRRNVTERLIYNIAVVFALDEDALKKGDVIELNNLKEENDDFLNDFIKSYENLNGTDKEAFKEFMYNFGIVKRDKGKKTDIS